MTLRALAPALLAAAALALAGCSGKVERPPCAKGQVCLEYGNTSDPTSLDPAKIDLLAESAIVGDLMMGLVQDDPRAKPAPGIATSWETSPDGLVWTFHLRNALWSDGEPVTADDFVFAYRRMEDPRTASPYAYLPYILKNAQAINEGKADPSTLGARALDAHTLQLTLEHPAPYLPELLKHASFYPVPKHVVEKWGDAWATPAHYVSDGPYVPTRWILGDHITVVKNPRFYDADEVCVNRIDYYPTVDAVSAERRVRRGELDINTTIQSNRVAYLKKPDQIPAYVRLHNTLSTTYLIFNTRDIPALRQVRVRQALSMAVDRRFITDKLMRSGQLPAYAFVPPGIADYQNVAHAYWSTWTLARRQAEAKRLLAQAGFGPKHPLRFELKFPNTNDASLMATAIQADWRSIGVQARLQQNEAQIAFQAFNDRDFEVGIASWIADYDDPTTFLGLLQSQTGAQNYGDYDNPAYDKLLAMADQEPDLQKRASYLEKAEQIALDDAAVGPIDFGVSRELVNPKITGWVGNVLDIHRARFLCVKGHAPQVPWTVSGRGEP